MRMVLIFLTFISTPSLADQASSLFDQCTHTSRNEWFKRYHEAEINYVEKVEELGPKAVEKMDENPDFWQLGKVVFPHDLPNELQLKGMYLTCFDSFSAYQKAKTAKDATEALVRYEQCANDSYKTNKPALLARVLTCLKSLKN